ncbi:MULTISPECIES: FeoA family protein [unclassified Luteococcus]|uniref:FeoA family protein n=1 Tax=unclassified Luteococcus TaxID=2639923 RepID=UPI00313E7C98
MNPISLATAPLRKPLTLVRAEGAPDLCRRLSALGIRRGAQVVLVHTTAGGGRVLQVAGSRIALDKTMLSRLFVEPMLTPEDLPEVAA